MIIMEDDMQKLMSGYIINCICVFFILTALLTTYSQILTQEDIQIYQDVVYSVVDGHELKLDIAVPKYLLSPAPAVVDIPGGAWRIVNKSVDDAVFWAKYGYVGVSITHRTSDIAVFPAAVHDCKTVIRWLRAHTDDYNINPDKIGVTGFSSGGYLAVLLGTSAGDTYLEGEGEFPKYSSAVQAVVDHFGPIDFLQMNDSTGLDLVDMNDSFAADAPPSLFLGGPLKDKTDLAKLANPINYIDPHDPPTLICHGEKDGMVIIKQSELLYNALTRAKVPVQFIKVKHAKHMFRPYKWDAEVSPSIDEIYNLAINWFEKYLGKPEIDLKSVKNLKKSKRIVPDNEYQLYYKLTVDIPGKTKNSYVKGLFRILCAGEILAKGEISLKNLDSEEIAIFQKEFIISRFDLRDKDIMWNFRGEIYDSKLDEKFGPMFMQGEPYNDSIEGVGYHIHINEQGNLNIEKQVYRKTGN